MQILHFERWMSLLSAPLLSEQGRKLEVYRPNCHDSEWINHCFLDDLIFVLDGHISGEGIKF